MAYKRTQTGDRSYRVDYDETEYLDSIEQYRGTEWYDQLAANPYLTDANSYQANWFESTFAEGLFGDTSRRQNWYNEMARNRDEYKAEILKKIQEAQHNSTAAQVERDKAAGLNPDLTGVSDAGQMTAAPQDENPPGAPEPMDPSMISGPATAVGNFALDLFAGLGKFASWIQEFRSAGLDNDLKELDLFTKANDVIPEADVEGEEYILPRKLESKGYTVDKEGKVIGPDGKPVKGTGDIDEDDPDVLNHLLDSIDGVLCVPKAANADGLIAKNKLFGSPRLRRFTQAVRDNYPKNSLKKGQLRNEAKENVLKHHKGQAEVIGDTYYDPDPIQYGTNIADFIENVDKKMSKLKRDTQSALKRSAEAQANYDETYYAKDEQGNVEVATADRQARLAEQARIEAMNKIDKIVDEEVDKWSEELKQKHTWWSSGIRLLLPQVRNALKENYISDLMHKFNFGQTETSTTTREGGVTTTTKQVK